MRPFGEPHGLFARFVRGVRPDTFLSSGFTLELLDSTNKVESLVTGKFQEKPGTTVEKVEWPLDYLANISPSSLGWRRLHYSFVQRPEVGVAPVEGFVQLSRVLVGVFEVRMTVASKAKPGNKFPVRIRVDDPSNGKAPTWNCCRPHSGVGRR
jgi:hypothetical protein